MKNKSISKFDSLKVYHIDIEYNDIFNSNLMFDIDISNNSKDTIRVDPNLFYYIPIMYKIDSVKEDSINRIYSIKMETTINDLKQYYSTKPIENNPYSLTSKTTGELVQYGFITGTIATIFGMSYEDLDKQRQYDEEKWDRSHIRNIPIIQNKLSNWEKRILKVTKLSPNDKIKGEVLFPLTNDLNEIEIILPIEGTFYIYRYKQN